MIEKYLKIIKNFSNKKDLVINILLENNIKLDIYNNFNIVDNVVILNLDSKNRFILNINKLKIISSLKDVGLILK